MPAERWRGGAVERWRGGEVERWRGGELERWSGGAAERGRTFGDDALQLHELAEEGGEQLTRRQAVEAEAAGGGCGGPSEGGSQAERQRRWAQLARSACRAAGSGHAFLRMLFNAAA